MFYVKNVNAYGQNKKSEVHRLQSIKINTKCKITYTQK